MVLPFFEELALHFLFENLFFGVVALSTALATSVVVFLVSVFFLDFVFSDDPSDVDVANFATLPLVFGVVDASSPFFFFAASAAVALLDGFFLGLIVASS